MIKQWLLNTLSTAATEAIKTLIQQHKLLHGATKNQQLKDAIENSFLLLKDISYKNKFADTLVNIVLNAIN